ncbi:glycosyltransferase family 2 protein [Pseudalkalibacillus salsuginis]|uniref:glycosyltransferase family 2 protein n=1 Tax=Pseudalkalibacillus salsuginis TaxID=2910972 RepID=UPI001F3B9382|nr:glycosyltransferase family 2 protein [Pseudalkalibacillus salsuginis]MCF6409171.1 glycosyltransferase [Pseudalkalibacillus salsuginis]
MNKSEVTVLTASFNPGEYLRTAVDSVRKQTYKEWRHVIVDDASEDDSLSSIIDHLDDPRVTLIKNEQNLGQSRSQNMGLSHVETPFILMLDSDDWLFDYTIEKLLDEANKVSEDVALICGNKEVVFDYGGKILGKYQDKWGRSFEDRYEFLLANYVPYPRFYRTSALRKVGGWPTDDPYEGRYLEDRRMDVRLIEHYKIHWIDEMLYNYRKHTDSLTNHIDPINEMIEWNIRDALKRWKSRYEPVFRMNNGTKELASLEKRKG